MKFANIDDAIMEAAKKPAAKPAPKTAAKKAEPKKAPAKPAAKVAPKPAPKPAAKRTSAKPAAKPAAKKTGNKKRVVTPPAPETDDKGTENKETEQKPTQEKPAETKPTQSADSSEPRKFAPRWLQSKPRGIGDRLKTAWKGFTAKAGDKIDVPHKYKSVFHEIQKLMEQLQLVEAMLQEQSLNESYDAGTVNNLYEHRNAIRNVLVEQMVREELYKHNVTIAELDQHQRAALMETVTLRANALWEGLDQMEEGKLGRNLALAAMLGGGLIGADRVHNTPKPSEPPAATAQAVKPTSADPLGIAARQAKQDTILNVGKDGKPIMSPRDHNTWIARYNSQTGAPNMEEAYTLEEWMGMMEEAGVNLNELSPELMGRYMDKAKSQVSQNIDRVGYNKQYRGGSGFDQAQRAAKDAKRIKGMTTALGSMDTKLQQRYNNPQGTTDVQKAADQKSTVDKFDRAADNLSRAKEYSKMAAESYTLEEWMGMMEEAGYNLTELSPELLKRYAKASKADMQKNLAKSTEKTLHVPGRARAEKRFQGQTAAFKRLGGDPDLAESINENTIARLQSLAGIKPTE